MKIAQLNSYFFLFIFTIILVACGTSNEDKESDPEKIDWKARELSYTLTDSNLVSGKSYLSIYSQVYSQTEHNTRDLTVTVSIRNPNDTDTLFLNSVKSYDTEGLEIKSYVGKTSYVRPMETLELVISEENTHNGTGGNFIFDWQIQSKSSEPIFEAVMISTAGQQGISFVTTAKRIK
ncbi:MAG: DUF3124 domain-containing protein [Crocinitomicaceae bacterium]